MCDNGEIAVNWSALDHGRHLACYLDHEFQAQNRVWMRGGRGSFDIPWSLMMGSTHPFPKDSSYTSPTQHKSQEAEWVFSKTVVLKPPPKDLGFNKMTSAINHLSSWCGLVWWESYVRCQARVVDFSKRELRRKSQSLPVREAKKDFTAGIFCCQTKIGALSGECFFSRWLGTRNHFLVPFFVFVCGLAPEGQRGRLWPYLLGVGCDPTSVWRVGSQLTL